MKVEPEGQWIDKSSKGPFEAKELTSASLDNEKSIVSVLSNWGNHHRQHGSGDEEDWTAKLCWLWLKERHNLVVNLFLGLIWLSLGFCTQFPGLFLIISQSLGRWHDQIKGDCPTFWRKPSQVYNRVKELMHAFRRLLSNKPGRLDTSSSPKRFSGNSIPY